MFTAGMLSSLTGLSDNHKQIEKPQKPNIVLIMADDLGYGDLNFYNSKHVNTPNLDALRKGGVLFTDFHSNGAVCSPTRAALLSGKYQQRVGIEGVVKAKTGRHDGMDEKVLTIAEELKSHNYRTGMFGKWHLGYDTIYNPVKQGFDEFCGFVSGNIDYHSHVDQEGYPDWYHQSQLRDVKGYSTDLITQDALGFINRNQNENFFLYLPYETPHYPYQDRMSKADRMVGGKPRVDFPVAGSSPDKKETYARMIEILDENIGLLMSRLKELNLLDNTLIVFCSDNGAAHAGSNGCLRGKKSTVFEGGHRVPALAYWQGQIEAGSVCNHSLLTFDLYPTFLDVIGVESIQARELDGVSFLKTLQKNKKIKRNYLVWRHGQQYAVRKRDYKLIVDTKKKDTLLFDLRKDLEEKDDLSKIKTHKVKQLLKYYKQWCVSVEK